MEGLESLMVLKEATPTTEKKWLRDNIFRSIGIVNGEPCMVVINRGSCENIISQALVDRLQLKVRKHHHPYFAKWLMTGDEMQIRYACSLTSSIGENNTYTVWCNVLPMDSGDFLLGRPWMYDKNGTNGMRDNTYTFMHSEKQITLHPMKSALPKKGSSSRITKEVL